MIGFQEVVRDEAQLRSLIGAPVERSLRKEITKLDSHCRAIIAASSFVVVASSDAEGNVDASPKGDRPGFVRVLDAETLALPDRPGNRRADTFTNVLANPRVGLLFLVPGNLISLRVNGRASIVRDAPLRESMAVDGKAPALALAVHVDQAFIHCGKCMLRSALWQPSSWPDVSALPSQARCLVDHGKLAEPLLEVEAAVERSRERDLY